MSVTNRFSLLFLLTAGWILASSTVCALDYDDSINGLGNLEFEGGRTMFEFADINNDGHVDILSIGDHGSPNINTNQHGVMVFFGDGAGRWQLFQNGDFGYGGIAIGDINNDGRWDIGYAMHHNYAGGDFGNQIIEAALGDGSGRNWQPWDDGLAVPQGNDDWYGMFGTDFGDFDNDGLLDIGSNSFGSGTGLHLYRNNGDGTWEDVFYLFGRTNSDMHFLFGDINNDGNLDFAASHQDHSLYFGDGQGGWEPAPMNGLPQPGIMGIMGIDLCDVNGDGADDLSFCNSSYGLEVYSYAPENERWIDLSGNLPAQAQYYYQTDLCDMDNDGDIDLVSTGVGGLQVWLSDAENNRWEQDWNVQINDFSSANALRAGGDIDHNGLPDIVALISVRTGLMQTQNFLHIYHETSAPEDLMIRPVEPGGNEVLTAGSARFIDWRAAIPDDYDADSAVVDLEVSVRGVNGPWEEIVNGYPNGGRYQWRVTNIESRNCFIRYRLRLGEEEVEAVTPTAFSIIGGQEVPILEVAPEEMVIEDAPVGQATEGILQVRNSGMGEMHVEPLELAVGEVFSIGGDNEAFAVNPEQPVEVLVVFEPNEAGFFTDTLRVESDGGRAVILIIGLTEGIEGPLLGLSTDTLDFGRVQVGRDSLQYLRFTNLGDARVLFSVPGSAQPPFTYERIQQRELEPGAHYDLAVTFVPQRYGQAEGRVVVTYQRGQLWINLRGWGFGQPVLALSADSLNFGDVLTIREADRVLAIHSVGDEAARVNIPSSEDEHFRWAVVDDAALVPGDSLSITLTFAPGDTGIYRGALRIVYQAGEETVPLAGRGILGPLIESPGDTLFFGEALLNRATDKRVVFRNVGTDVAQLLIERASMGAYHWNTSGRFNLNPQDSVLTFVTFTPTAVQTYLDSLEYSYQCGNFKLYLHGWGVRVLETADGALIPVEFGFLELNPNPFNHEISISYGLPVAGLTELKMYDLAGRLVCVPLQAVQTEGTHRLVLSGEGLNAGTYFLVIQQAGERDVRKMVYIR